MAALFLAACCANARADLSIVGTANHSTINLGETIVYIISVQNDSAIAAQNVVISSTFPGNAVIIRATNSIVSPLVTSLVTTNRGLVNLTLSNLPGSSAIQLIIELQPGTAGSFTNSLSAAANGLVSSTGEIVVTVGRLNTDLKLTTTALPSSALAGDYLTFNVAVVNLGPSTANGVTITSVLPTNTMLISVIPTGHSAFANRVLTLSVGTLTNGATTNFTVTIQPGAAGSFIVTNSVQAADIADLTTSNNSTAASINIAPFVPTDIKIVSLSDFVYNQNTALFDQIVTLSNTSTSTLFNIHLIATNLASSNKLWNVAGTNAAHPFVLLDLQLAPGEMAQTTVEFFFAKRAPSPVAIIAAGQATTFSSISVTNLSLSASGDLSLQVPAVTNRTYSVLYATNVVDLILPATNAVRTTGTVATNGSVTLIVPAPPLPTTNSPTTTRFVRVIENQ